MKIRNPQSAIRNRDGDYITVDEAARMTGKSVRTWQWRAKREAERAERFGWDAKAILAPTPDGNGRSGWWVHRSLDDRLRRQGHTTGNDEVRDPLSAKYPQHVIERALRKHHWVREWQKLCDRNRDPRVTDRDLARRIVSEARRVEGDGFRVSIRSLVRWRSECSKSDIEALIDKHIGPSGCTRSPEAVAWFYDLYHTQSRHPINVCHDVTLREARKRGWSWPASGSATVAWLAKHDDLSLTCLMRDGKDVWARKFLPHLQADESTLEPGALFVCDHHQCDWWVTYQGKQIRPWLTSVQDRKSRCIVGWHLGPTPHQDAILSSLRRAFRDWAVPRVLRIDNGRDYKSKLVTGMTKQERDRLRRAFGADWLKGLRRQADLVTCEDHRWLGITGLLGIELIYSTPYAAWAKGTQERWFGTLEGQHGKTYPTYCGNSTLAKPECLEEIRRGFSKAQKRELRKRHGRDWKRIAVLKFVDQADVPTLEASRERIGEYLDIYHRTKHRTLGEAPLAVWKRAASLRRAVADDLAFLMDLRGLYTVGGNGVSLKVGPATLSYGAKSEPLKRWKGRKVLIALDADDIGHCWAFTPEQDKYRMIGRLESNQTIEPYTTADDAREAIAEIKREQSIMHKAARSAARRTRTAVQRINEHSRAKRAELLATGTDDVVTQARIVPVRTGFEGMSKPSRSAFESSACCPMEPGDLADLFDETETVGVINESDNEWDVSDLLVDDDTDDDTPDDDGLEDLL